MLEYKEDEDTEGLSQDQSKLHLNLEIFSKFRIATPCEADSETLTMPNEEGPVDKVVDLFEIINLESEFALFGLRMRELWSK